MTRSNSYRVGGSLLEKTALFVASLAFTSCVFLLGQAYGIEEGILSANGIESESQLAAFTTHGPNFFHVVTGQYMILTACFFGYLIGKLIAHETTSRLLCVGASGLAVIFYWGLLAFKLDIDPSAVLLYNRWLASSIRLDYLGMTAGIVLLLFEVIGAMTNLYNKRHRSSELPKAGSFL